MNIPLESFPIQFQQNFERGYSLDIKKTRLIENTINKKESTNEENISSVETEQKEEPKKEENICIY